jgi:diguanylate cyclase (GGDEF)-like protein
MRNILLLDKGDSSVQGFKKSLESEGHSLIDAHSPKGAFTILNQGGIDLIVIDKTFSLNQKDLGKFRKIAADIPKIILTHEKGFKGLRAWLKEELVIPLNEPVTYREFRHWMDKLGKDMSIADKNRKLQKELCSKKKELVFFEDITGILTSTLEIDKILKLIMDKAKILIGFNAWSILLVEGVGDELIFGKNQNKNSVKIHKFKVKPGEGIAGWVVQQGVPVIVPDVLKDKRFDKKVDRFPRLKTRSLICIPVMIKNKIAGVFEFHYNKGKKVFSEDDTELLIKLVGYAAMAIEKTLLYQKMEDLAVTDELTNLFNIRYLNRTLDIELERSQRFGSSFSLIFMDLDYFKKVNDTYGHLVGSKLLIEVAQLILSSLRTVDTVARYGGDEFVIILPQTPLDGGFYVADRLRKSMEKKTFLKQEGLSIRVTACFGVASYPENAKTKEELLKIADQAMYRGKDSTRNIVYAAGD